MKSASRSSIAFVVFVLSFIALATGTQGIPHPGQSTSYLVQFLGIDPLPLFTSPIYGWIIRALAAISGSSAMYAINLFSVLCGAGLLALVFLLVYQSARSFNIESSIPVSIMHRIQVGAGLISVLFLLANGPFWMASTQANPVMFDLLLLLGSFYLIVSSFSREQLLRVHLATLLYGIAIVEFSTAVLVAPIYIVLVLMILWRIQSFTFKNISVVCLFGLAGLSLYLVQAGFFMVTPSYEWREFRNIFQVVWYIWQEQYQSMTGGLPRVGWLSLAFVSFIPWLVTSSFRLSGGSSRARGALVGTGVVYLTLGVLAILLLLKNFPLSPINLTGTNRLFVTPYLLIGLWVGNIMAFWLVILFREKRFEADAFRATRRVIGTILSIAVPIYLLFVIVTAAYPKTREIGNQAVLDFAAAMVDSAADKEWLISNSLADEQIMLEAHLRGIPLNVLRLSRAGSPAYMKYVASRFDDNPRLQSLARIGLSPLLDEWFFSMPDVEKKVAVAHIPDMWMVAGFESVPDRVLFEGVKTGEPVNLDELLARHRAFWDGYGAALVALDVDKESASGITIGWIRVHLSKVANNLGVYLEDNEREDDAFSCYRQARVFAPDNLSALMNMHVMAHRKNLPEFTELDAELTQRTEAMMGRVQSMSLSHVYGYVRLPELFANRGLSFAMSGKANMAISDMKRALNLREGNPQIQMALAELYFNQDQDAQSKEYYQNVLETNPNNAGAVLGLSRIATRQGEFGEARRYHAQLKDMGVAGPSLKMEEAVLEAVSGSPSEAIKILMSVTREQPENMQAWALIAVLAIHAKDNVAGEQAVSKLRDAKVLAPAIQLVMAQSALNQGDRDGARRHINDILRRQPGNAQALELLLRIEMFEGSRDQIQKTVERILTYSPRNALANYLLGVHHYYKEEYALAESAYRVSIATTKTPPALNDLAFVLYIQDRAVEAEPFVRESLAMNDRNSSAWDTLGVILMARGKLDEAEAALQKSLELRPDTASVLLSLALLHEKQSKWIEANAIAEQINARMNELSPQAQHTLRDLRQRLQEKI